jgi:cytochrome b involved in lipid metabolism
MNLRDIKKDIQYVIGAFVDDCTLFLDMHPGQNADEIADLIDKAVDLYNDLRDKVVKSAGAEKPKVCFTSIRKELLEKTDALYDELSEAVKKGLGE